MDKTFVKGMRLAEALSRRDKPAGVTDLARELHLTKSNVQRLLQTLVSMGYARRSNDAGHYELTLRLWEMGSRVIARMDVKHTAAPHLRELSERTSETVHLSIFDEGNVIYIDKIDSPQPVRAYSAIGGRAPAYCVATGKALLAHQPEEVIKAVAKALQPFTALTVNNTVALEKELAQVRRVGFAINRGEWRETVCGVAAPIRNANGVVIAAVGLSGPAERLRARKLRDFAPEVIAAAQAISHDLGYMQS